ncbi:hypothetical protein ALC60_09429 [Trachymyrmex zeteki]|uniref:Uncharacterized protein n=1 Tax=Mycetomoellerius zeteki TaxID=64791 RepID=A0A151WUL0_9HYME|nr:hypothetical protein ALC60_09429 [Trachymyrmex zeteki]
MDKVVMDLKGSPALVNRHDPEEGLEGDQETQRSYRQLRGYKARYRSSLKKPRLLHTSERFDRVHSWTREAARNRGVILSARTGQCEKRNGMRRRRNVLGERVTGEDARPRDEGNKWFEEPVETGPRTKDTLPAPSEPPSSNSRGEKEGEEEEEKEESHCSSARREGVRMGERLTQEEEKDHGDSDGRGRYLNPNQLSTLIHAMHTTIQFSYTILRQLHSTITDLMTLPHSFASPRLAKAEETATGFEIIRSIGPALGRNVSGRSSHEDRSILRLTSARLNERRVGGERERGGYGAILQLQQTAECSNRFDNDVLNG